MNRKCLIVLSILILLASTILGIYVQLVVKVQMKDTLEVPFIYNFHTIVANPSFWTSAGFLAAAWLVKSGSRRRIFLYLGILCVAVYGIAWCFYQEFARLYVVLVWVIENPIIFVLPGIFLGIGRKK